MNDPIADMLTRIRNAYATRLAKVAVPYSKHKEELAKLLNRNGLVGEVKVDKTKHALEIALLYEDGQPVASYLKRISRPGLRVYKRRNRIGRIRRGLGLSIISTNQGLMTDSEARKRKLGGEIIAEVW